MSTQIIQSRPAGYGKEQVRGPRRCFALPVLLTGAAQREPEAHARAFTLALGCNVALLAFVGVLSLSLAAVPSAARPATRSRDSARGDQEGPR